MFSPGDAQPTLGEHIGSCRLAPCQETQEVGRPTLLLSMLAMMASGVKRSARPFEKLQHKGTQSGRRQRVLQVEYVVGSITLNRKELMLLRHPLSRLMDLTCCRCPYRGQEISYSSRNAATPPRESRSCIPQRGESRLDVAQRSSQPPSMLPKSLLCKSAGSACTVQPVCQPGAQLAAHHATHACQNLHKAAAISSDTCNVCGICLHQAQCQSSGAQICS